MSYRPASIGGLPAVSNAFFALCRCKKDMSGGQRASTAKATCAHGIAVIAERQRVRLPAADQSPNNALRARLSASTVSCRACPARNASIRFRKPIALFAAATQFSRNGN
ncbi:MULTISPECIES: hypothetical protein [unclassified Sphingomonas]|uniref:hypothetical protein n=1 Tax=unclassified Sphingomonas TaxID=196159 RepID=UPI000A52E046|nr:MULTISPECIES: hypothetical protein [unclassified Sphingomonas]